MTWSLKKSIKRRQTTHRCPGHRGVIFCWCPVYFDSWCPGYRWVPTPYVPDTGEFWLPMSRIPRSFDFRCPGYRGVLIPGVPDTGRVSNIATAFKAIIIVNLSFTIQIHLVHDFKTFLWLPVSQTPGNLFKLYITPRKLEIAWGILLQAQEKNRLQKSHATVPLRWVWLYITWNLSLSSIIDSQKILSINDSMRFLESGFFIKLPLHYQF